MGSQRSDGIELLRSQELARGRRGQLAWENLTKQNLDKLTLCLWWDVHMCMGATCIERMQH
jgi:hypothetical protein